MTAEYETGAGYRIGEVVKRTGGGPLLQKVVRVRWRGQDHVGPGYGCLASDEPERWPPLGERIKVRVYGMVETFIEWETVEGDGP